MEESAVVCPCASFLTKAGKNHVKSRTLKVRTRATVIFLLVGFEESCVTSMAITSESSLLGDFLVIDGLRLNVLDIAAGEHAELLDVMKREYRSDQRTRSLDVKEVGVVHVVHPEHRPCFRLFEGDLDVGELDVSDMTQKKSAGRNVAEHVGIGPWIVLDRLGRVKRGHFLCAAARVLEIAIVNLDIFDRVTGNAR